MTLFTSFTILVTTTGNLAQLTLNIMDFTSSMTSVSLPVGFSDTPGTYAAAHPRQSRSLTVQPSHRVFQLSQLHLQFTFIVMDFTSYMSSVRLQFGFSGAPCTNAAAKPRQSRSLTVQPRQQVFQLCQLHLQFTFFCMSAFGENIQYKLTPMDNLCSE